MGVLQNQNEVASEARLQWKNFLVDKGIHIVPTSRFMERQCEEDIDFIKGIEDWSLVPDYYMPRIGTFLEVRVRLNYTLRKELYSTARKAQELGMLIIVGGTHVGQEFFVVCPCEYDYDVTDKIVSSFNKCPSCNHWSFTDGTQICRVCNHHDSAQTIWGLWNTSWEWRKV